MDSYTTFFAGMGIGMALMAIISVLSTNALIRHYLRQGWLRFPPPPTNDLQRCIDALVLRRTNPWMIYGSKCDPFRADICAAAERTGEGLWQCQCDGKVPEQYRHLYPIEEAA